MKAIAIIAVLLAACAAGASGALLFDVAETQKQMQPMRQELAKLQRELAKTQMALDELTERPAAAIDLGSVGQEPQWARQVAESYLLAAGQDCTSSDTLAWTSAAMRERLEKGSRFVYFGFKTWNVQSVEMSPGSDEAVVKGSVDAVSRGSYRPGAGGGSDPKFRGKVPFTLRVAYFADDGKWRVDAMHFEGPSAELD